MKIPERFLIIDDEPLNNKLCQMVLEKAFENPDIVTFTEPERGIEYIEDGWIKDPVNTVLFLDINMPTLTGWEVLDKLKDLSGKLKESLTIFILSSSIDQTDKKKAKDSPLVSGYLEKPLTLARLHAIFK